MTKKTIPLLDTYAGKNYSFVISWISSHKRFYPFSHLLPLYVRIFGGEFVGVTIKFPTKKIYYPMLLTSIYGDRKIKIRIYIENFVEVDQEELSKIGKVEYYVTSSGKPAYTKIEFDAPARYYTKDLISTLWFQHLLTPISSSTFLLIPSS